MNPYLSTLLAAVALTLSFGAKATLSYVSVVVDKVMYNQDYVMGVDVSYSGQPNDIVDVSANHQSIGQRSFGTWGLNRLSDGRWWEWASGRIPMSSGPITGTVSITEQNSSDVTTNFDVFNFRPGEEMAIPTWTVSKEKSSYKINTLGVSGADYYNLWLWDWTDLKYVSSQRVVNITDLQSISFDGLVDGRTYNMYLIANHQFSEVSANFTTAILYRSYDLQYLTYSATAIPVPEPETYSLMLAGLAFMGTLSRRKVKQANTQLRRSTAAKAPFFFRIVQGAHPGKEFSRAVGPNVDLSGICQATLRPVLSRCLIFHCMRSMTDGFARFIRASRWWPCGSGEIVSGSTL